MQKFREKIMRKFREKNGNYAKNENFAKNTEFLITNVKFCRKSVKNLSKKTKF